jgi:hypothetical protein
MKTEENSNLAIQAFEKPEEIGIRHFPAPYGYPLSISTSNHKSSNSKLRIPSAMASRLEVPYRGRMNYKDTKPYTMALL